MTAQHTYNEGEFRVTFTITDSTGKSTTLHWSLDIRPAPDTLSGQGTFISPPGANRIAPLQSGLASFAYRAPAQGQGRPAKGQTAARLETAGLRFHSDQVEAVTVRGPHVQFEGSGSINRAGGYRFVMKALRGKAAGGQDRVGMRIWHHDARRGTDVVDYDNMTVLRPSGSDAAGSSIIEDGHE